MHFKLGAPQFHFTLVPANYADGPALWPPSPHILAKWFLEYKVPWSWREFYFPGPKSLRSLPLQSERLEKLCMSCEPCAQWGCGEGWVSAHPGLRQHRPRKGSSIYSMLCRLLSGAEIHCCGKLGSPHFPKYQSTEAAVLIVCGWPARCRREAEVNGKAPGNLPFSGRSRIGFLVEPESKM